MKKTDAGMHEAHSTPLALRHSDSDTGLIWCNNVVNFFAVDFDRCRNFSA